MIYEVIDLYEHFGVKKPQGAKGYLTAYVHHKSTEFAVKRKRPAMLVIPGGGYVFCSDREKEPFALYYMNRGFQAFTLEYSVLPVRYPAQYIEGCMAVAYIRENADRFNIRADKVAAVGFSAGGHLCGMLATQPDADLLREVLPSVVGQCRPNAVILSYPVISFGTFGHLGSSNSLCGDDIAKTEYLSLENRVNSESAPAFIWHTADDTCVPVENSLLIAEAYRRAGVPFELHIFRSGNHGLALCSEETAMVSNSVQLWLLLSDNWLRDLDFKVLD